MKKISVVMSCYNEEKNHLTKAIESILNQDYKNFEFIIIIDNPDNKVLIDTVNTYSEIDNRIVVIFNEKNLGLAQSLNKGIEIATGEYVARMDADDIALPDRFSKQVDYLDNHSECIMVCGNIIKIDENGSVIGKNRTIPKNDEALRELVKYQYIIQHPTVMMRRQQLNDIGKYNNYRAAQDYDLWLRMVKNKYNMHFIIEPLVKYRYRITSIGGTRKNIQFLSCQFARRLFYNDLTFNEDEYEEFINKKLCDQKYNKGIKYYYNGISKKSIRLLLLSILLNCDCRKECFNLIRARKFTKKMK